MSVRQLVVFEIGAVLALEPAYARSVRGAVAGYGAIVGAPVGAEAEWSSVCAAATPEERVGLQLAAWVGGATTALSWVRVGRLVMEHLLGAALHAAVYAQPPRDAFGAGALELVTPSPVARGLAVAPGGARRALVARLPAPVVLYLLAQHGLTGVFDAVVGRDAVAGRPVPLADLVAEAAARLGGTAPLRVVAPHPQDLRALRAAGFDAADCQPD